MHQGKGKLAGISVIEELEELEELKVNTNVKVDVEKSLSCNEKGTDMSYWLLGGKYLFEIG